MFVLVPWLGPSFCGGVITSCIYVSAGLYHMSLSSRDSGYPEFRGTGSCGNRSYTFPWIRDILNLRGTRSCGSGSSYSSRDRGKIPHPAQSRGINPAGKNPAGKKSRRTPLRFSGLFPVHDPTRGSSQEVLTLSQVGSCRVGSGRVKIFVMPRAGSGRVGSGRVGSGQVMAHDKRVNRGSGQHDPWFVFYSPAGRTRASDQRIRH